MREREISDKIFLNASSSVINKWVFHSLYPIYHYSRFEFRVTEEEEVMWGGQNQIRRDTKRKIAFDCSWILQRRGRQEEKKIVRSHF